MSELHVVADDKGRIEVDFLNEHIDKRTLLRIIRAIKIQHRIDIQKYRQNIIKEKEKRNELRRKTNRT